MAGEGGGKTDSLAFHMQIGLVRESVTVQMEGGNLTLTTLKDIACAFVDRKVGQGFLIKSWLMCRSAGDIKGDHLLSNYFNTRSALQQHANRPLPWTYFMV